MISLHLYLNDWAALNKFTLITSSTSWTLLIRLQIGKKFELFCVASCVSVRVCFGGWGGGMMFQSCGRALTVNGTNVKALSQYLPWLGPKWRPAAAPMRSPIGHTCSWLTKQLCNNTVEFLLWLCGGGCVQVSWLPLCSIRIGFEFVGWWIWDGSFPFSCILNHPIEPLFNKCTYYNTCDNLVTYFPLFGEPLWPWKETSHKHTNKYSDFY